MPYAREELDWIEAEWAFHLHGHRAFLSREDFLQAQQWGEAGVPAEAVVAAMEAYFQRRAKRAKPRTFVALSHLEKDVVKAVKLREALRRSEPESLSLEGWEQVKAPLRDDPKARSAFEAWRRLQARTPPPDDPGYLDHFDETRSAFRQLVKVAEVALGPEAEKLRTALAARLAEAKLEEDSLVWKRAWDHHWGRTLCEAWGIPC